MKADEPDILSGSMHNGYEPTITAPNSFPPVYIMENRAILVRNSPLAVFAHYCRELYGTINSCNYIPQMLAYLSFGKAKLDNILSNSIK